MRNFWDFSCFATTWGLAGLTGLTSGTLRRRKARVLSRFQIRGPCVAHSKFGPGSGLEPAPNGAPCIDSECRGTYVLCGKCASRIKQFPTAKRMRRRCSRLSDPPRDWAPHCATFGSWQVRPQPVVRRVLLTSRNLPLVHENQAPALARATPAPGSYPVKEQMKNLDSLGRGYVRILPAAALGTTSDLR